MRLAGVERVHRGPPHVVPEDRTRPSGVGNEVRLAVAALSRAGAGAAQPPTFMRGPDQGVVALFATVLAERQALLHDKALPEEYHGHRGDIEQYKAVRNQFVADLEWRPFVGLDQRGADYSQSCPTVLA